MHAKGKPQAQKGHEKTLSLYLNMIPGTEPDYSNQKTKAKSSKGAGGESNFQSYHIIKFKFPVFNSKTITRHRKKQESLAHSKKKLNQQKLSLRKT